MVLSFTSIGKIVIILAVSIISVFCYNCFKPINTELLRSGAKSPSHELWNGLLGKAVSASGKVNYKVFIADSIKLNGYLKLLSDNPPDISTWSVNERKAYWINVYNAYTIKLVISHYPVKSIKDIGSKIQIPFVNSPWDIELISIDGLKMDLNDIEHKILRAKFDDPRIHFAINCASVSCPDLLNEAFYPEILDKQLNRQARTFINDPNKNIITVDKLRLSEIFNWFSGDFTKDESLIHFLNKYSEVKISESAKIKYLDYDWHLNE